MAKAYRAIGLMSGTSMDGVDVAALETDGETVGWTGPSVTVPYDSALRARLDRAVRAPEDPGHDLTELERDLTDAHAAAVEAFLPALPGRSPPDRCRRLPWPHAVPSAGGAPDLPARRRRAPRRPARDRRGLRLPQRRRGCRRPGRAARSGLSSGARGRAREARGDPQPRRRRQRDLDRRSRADRVRHRAGQRPDRRLGARAHRSALR